MLSDEKLFRVSSDTRAPFVGASGEFVQVMTLDQLIAFLEHESSLPWYEKHRCSFKLEVEYLPAMPVATNIRPLGGE